LGGAEDHGSGGALLKFIQCHEHLMDKSLPQTIAFFGKVEGDGSDAVV
jgi:hypothetical protein